MKTTAYKIAIIILTFSSHVYAQQLETIYINDRVSTHFITSEPIQYVDISTDYIAGDMPMSTILRLKPAQIDSINHEGVVTIVCQKYMVQYRLQWSDVQTATKRRFISGKDGFGLLLPELTISAAEMKTLSSQVLHSSGKKTVKKVKQSGMKMTINKICSSGDYYFIDVSIRNNSNITFEVEHLDFCVRDKRVLSATNVQRIRLEPEFKLYRQKQIRKRYRNVFVFKKFTFPNEKVFEIALSEKQLSGRTMKIQVDYKEVLGAEPI